MAASPAVTVPDPPSTVRLQLMQFSAAVPIAAADDNTGNGKKRKRQCDDDSESGKIVALLERQGTLLQRILETIEMLALGHELAARELAVIISLLQKLTGQTPPPLNHSNDIHLLLLGVLVPMAATPPAAPPTIADELGLSKESGRKRKREHDDSSSSLKTMGTLERQESLLQKFLATIEGQERERIVRDEAISSLLSTAPEITSSRPRTGPPSSPSCKSSPC